MEEPIGERDRSVRSISITGTALLLHTLYTEPAEATCNAHYRGLRGSVFVAVKYTNNGCSECSAMRSRVKPQ